jgi:transcriptional regulator NrdR family protein
MNYRQTQIANWKKTNHWQTGKARLPQTDQIKKRNCEKCCWSFETYSHALLCGIRIIDGDSRFSADFKTGKTAACDKYAQREALA